MYCNLTRRELEYQPATACIDVGIVEHVGEERAVRNGVTAVDDDVASGNHHAILHIRSRGFPSGIPFVFVQDIFSKTSIRLLATKRGVRSILSTHRDGRR